MARSIDYHAKQLRMWFKLWKAGIVKEEDIPKHYKKLIEIYYLNDE